MLRRLHGIATATLVIALLAAFGAGPGAAQDKQKPSAGDKSSEAGAAPLSPAQKRAIEDVVREYILQNPEVIVEAVRGLQEREKQETRERAQKTLATAKEELLRDPDSPVGGNLQGDVTIVEFFDYRCGFCKKVQPDLIEVLKTDKKVRIVFKEFPILGPESVVASKAAIAAWLTDKGKYEAFHEATMKATGALPEGRLMKIAAGVGLDVKALKKTMDDPRIARFIDKNYALAEALDIKGTPAFVIGDHIVRGAIDLEAMKLLIAKARGG